MRTRLLATSGTAVLATAATVLALTTPAQASSAWASSSPSTRTSATAPAAHSGWHPRPAQYAKTVTRKDLVIPMSDGVKLRGDLTLPAKADGTAVPKRFPVVVTITAYNKSFIESGGSGLAGADPAYLVKRGYAQLTVDARGTGSSEGSWCAFCTREDKDSAAVMAWAHRQKWSNGRTAMTGASYMGINQIFAAAGRPPGLKAIFPQVPAGDVYRDVVASGGQVDVGFIPAWLGLVTTTGEIPPAFTGTDPTDALQTLVTHAEAAAMFSGKLLVEAAAGQDAAYDGPFYHQRSPINVISKVDVPTFLISGEYDLFQRGTPTLFANLRRRGVPTKLIIGPWDHLQGSSGAQVGKAGYGSLSQLQLRWFDHYVKGRPDPTLSFGIAPLTYYEQGSGRWLHGTNWLAHRTARTFHLSGSTTTAGTPGALTSGTPKSGTATILPVPIAGLCTRSTDQWTAGIPNEVAPNNPCLTNNAPNDRAGVVFDTPALEHAVRFQGPIAAKLYVSSTSGDGMLSVAVEDVAPDGTVSRLTGGWQVISLRQLESAKSTRLDGKIIRPYHPYTKASQHKLAAGQVAPVQVEVFPTGADVKPGHHLRIAVQAFDVPHLSPTLTELPGALSILTVHESAKYPSQLVLPGLS